MKCSRAHENTLKTWSTGIRCPPSLTATSSVTVWWTGFVITEACTCSPLLVDYLLQLSSNPLSHQLIGSVYGCTNTLVIGYSTKNSFEYPGIHIKHIFSWLMRNYEYPQKNETFHFRINHQVTLAPSTKHIHFLLFLPLCE